MAHNLLIVNSGHGAIGVHAHPIQGQFRVVVKQEPAQSLNNLKMVGKPVLRLRVDIWSEIPNGECAKCLLIVNGVRGLLGLNGQNVLEGKNPIGEPEQRPHISEMEANLAQN